MARLASGCGLRVFVERVLVAAGAPSAHAAMQTGLLIQADLRGRASHGVLRLPRLIEGLRNGVADPATTGEHNWTGAAFLVVDGKRGPGPVVASAAIEALSTRATETGVAGAAIRKPTRLEGAVTHEVRS